MHTFLRAETASNIENKDYQNYSDVLFHFINYEFNTLVHILVVAFNI